MAVTSHFLWKCESGKYREGNYNCLLYRGIIKLLSCEEEIQPECTQWLYWKYILVLRTH